MLAVVAREEHHYHTIEMSMLGLENIQGHGGRGHLEGPISRPILTLHSSPRSHHVWRDIGGFAGSLREDTSLSFFPISYVYAEFSVQNVKFQTVHCTQNIRRKNEQIHEFIPHGAGKFATIDHFVVSKWRLDPQ